MPSAWPLRNSLAMMATVGLVAALSCALCGLGGPLHHDAANHVYSGQQMVEGVPPYASLFNHVGPLSPMLCGGAVACGRFVGIDDVLAVRLVFIAVATLAAVVLAGVGRHVTGTVVGAMAAGLTLPCFGRFVLEAASGPDKKVLLILLEALFLLAVAHRRWFLAGAWGALALLVWQGALVLPLVAAGLVAVEPRTQRRRSLLLLTAGAALPMLLVTAYFAAFHALGDLVDGMVLVNLQYVEPGHRGLVPQVVHIVRQAWQGYPGSVWLLATGLAATLAAGLQSRTAGTAPPPILTRASAACAVGFLAVSMVDFQGPPDLFPFLPLAALGVAGPVAHAAARHRTLVVLVVVSLAAAALSAGPAQRRDGLASQRRTLARLFRELGEPRRLLVIAEPAASVLSGRTNPTRFFNVYRGFDRFIDDHFPGGFAGWVASLAAFEPDLVIVGPTSGTLTVHLKEWYRRDYRRYPGTPWNALVPRAAPRTVRP